ncbi:hypothetical protein GCM10027346_12320 [Hymenobacter seoulensis]
MRRSTESAAKRLGAAATLVALGRGVQLAINRQLKAAGSTAARYRAEYIIVAPR